jgi:hypothetical protein
MGKRAFSAGVPTAQVATIEKGKEPAIQRRSWSVPEFAARHGIGNTLAWELVKTGKLKARKIGNRTIVTAEDEAAFIAALPLANEVAA